MQSSNAAVDSSYGRLTPSEAWFDTADEEVPHCHHECPLSNAKGAVCAYASQSECGAWIVGPLARG